MISRREVRLFFNGDLPIWYGRSQDGRRRLTVDIGSSSRRIFYLGYRNVKPSLRATE